MTFSKFDVILHECQMRKQEPPRMRSREKLKTKERHPVAVSEPVVQSASDQDSARAAPVEQPDARHELIALQAYYRAEARGFTPGAELDDWLAAEAQVDSRPRETRPEADAVQRAR
jgi:hypothetical protein